MLLKAVCYASWAGMPLGRTGCFLEGNPICDHQLQSKPNLSFSLQTICSCLAVVRSSPILICKISDVGDGWYIPNSQGRFLGWEFGSRCDSNQTSKFTASHLISCECWHGHYIDMKETNTIITSQGSALVKRCSYESAKCAETLLAPSLPSSVYITNLALWLQHCKPRIQQIWLSPIPSKHGQSL